MKNILRVTVLAICAIFMVANVSAQVITAERASEIANQFFANGKQKSAAFRSTSATLTQSVDSHAITGESNEAPTFHILTGADGKGFVIVSGEETENPIIGYSLDGTIDTNNLPDGFVGYMTDIDAQVRALREYNAANPQKATARSAMQKAADYEYNATSMGNIVKNLNTAPWGQHGPFNNLCKTADGQTALTGCGPTAFAILCYYYKWPASGVGTVTHQGTGENMELGHTYDYASMRNDDYRSGYTEAEANAVAVLMRDLGWANQVGYGTGSTSFSETGQHMVDHFRFKSERPVDHGASLAVVRSTLGNDTQWKTYIKNCLDAGYPIPYASTTNTSNSARHIYILDGYTDNDYYHFNWGWSGQGNGWFTLDNMVPDDYSNYSNSHKAYFNLIPDATTYTVTATVNDSNMGTVSINSGTAGSTVTANLMQGVTATLTAHPAQGYALASWTKNGVVVGSRNTIQVTVGTDANDYVANFDDEANVLVEKDCTFKISDVATSGVSGSYCSTWTTSDGIVLSCSKGSEPAYALSTTVNTFFAKATVGNSETLVSDITYTLTAPAGYVIKSYSFKGKSPSSTYTIDVTVGGNTTNVTNASAGVVISASDINAQSTSFILGSTYAGRAGLAIMENGVTVTIQSEGGSSTPTTKTYTINVTANPGTGGTATVNGNSSATVTESESVTLAATAANGYTFTGWYKGAEKVSGDANYTFTPTESASYEARFVAKAVSNCNIPTDNTLRYYRFAIAIAKESYTTDFGSNYENVKKFWQECEDFMNEVYVPLGMCFDVVIDQRLLLGTDLPDNNGLPNISGVTDLINNAIGSGSYDVGLCISYRDNSAENTGLSAVNGAYTSTTKANGYAQADKWVVAHEAGHLFGADHTTEGESSLMDNIGEFFSYPSIKKIRDASVNSGPGNAYKSEVVANNAPTFTAQMKKTYRIPKGACLSIPVYASDADGHSLRYAAIGCSSSTVGNITGGGTMPHFASLKPQTSNIIDYRPEFVADGDSYYLPVDGTNIPSMSAGSYSIAILVNDMPEGNSYDYLNSNPFYSNYDVWDATVEIVDGNPFTASISPAQNSYTAGSDVTVTWVVNNSVFTEDSRVRITMSTDYGKTFSHVLADDVRALDGSKAVTLPNVNVGNVDVDFSNKYVNAVRSMRAGIIRVEVIDGAAYTLTTLSPENGGGFNITGGGAEPDPTPVTYAITTAANPAEGGTAKFSVGTGSQQTEGDVNSGELITLYAVANDGYRFVNWTLNSTEVSTDATCNVTASQAANYVANFEAEAQTEQFPDGAYKIYWQADNRGYLAYHATDYPNEAKLAGVTYSGCQDIHYAVNQVDLVWYLITADDGKRYLFQAATGKFLGVDTSIQANCTGNKLSTTEAWPIAIEENTNHTGHYIITTMINGTNNLLCSGCGTPKEQHPVRWLIVNEANQTDGGAPLQLIPVNDVTVADNVMNAVLAVINGTDEPEQPTDPLAGKYFRLKVKNTTNYMNIANTSNNTGSTSGVTVVAKNESSDTQIFLFEQSNDGYKLKANSGNYIKCHAWNANANATTAGDATELTFESTGNELEYFIKWDHTNMNQGVERDDYFKAENGYVYCDAASTAATVWVLEEVIPSNEKTLTVTYSGATWNNEASGWWVSVVTNTTPAVTVKTTDGTPKIGFSTFNEVRHPYLLDGNSFTISVPANCKITGYRLGYQAHNLVSKSVTYTNGKESTGIVTITQSNEQNTLTVTGLDNNEISFSVEDQTTQAGFIIKSLEITYVENEFEPLPFKAEIENWRNDNPNTHLGTITIGGTAMKLTPAHQTASELTMPVVEGTTLAFTRKYRGFEFNGFYIGSTPLGENPTLTADNVAAIDENNPLIAKFTATDDVTLFYDDDEFSYRIPAIAKTGTNRLVAVSDYRHSHDDIGRDNHGTGTNRVDLVMRTSDDNGLTWSAKQTIAEGTSTFGYGDAAIAANGQDILVMAVAGNVFYPTATATSNNKTYRIYSNNNGVSWTKEEVTSNIFGLFDEAYATFFGSGKLAVDPDFNGTGKARVYGAILLKNSARSTNNYVLFSDDWGATWNILGGSKTQIAEADEPKVEILPNGQILLSSRHASGGSRVFNVFTYGNDKAAGEGTWGTAVSGCSNGGSNGTNGEIICLDAKQTNGKPTKILLQSQPQGGSNTWDRKNVTIWYKEIGNETQTPSSIADGWTKGKQVSTVQSAYSAMALQENGEIALFFEEAPCYGDDNTKGYSMVYVPLTIEEITENNFLNPNADVEYVPTEFNIVLTDAQDNEYRETLDYIPADVAAVESYLTTTYPFITLGTTGAIADNKYTNTVTLPFKVSNSENAYWHNIYWPANGTSTGEFYPIYLKAETEDATYITKLTEYGKRFGESQYNTCEHADKLGWAVYSVNNTLTFKFKNKLTGKYMAVNGVVSSGNADNVIFTDEAGATVFTLEKYTGANTAWGDYGLKSVYNGTTGYVCNTSAGYANATNYTGTGHPGAWVEFGDADYDLLISNLDQGLILFGNGNDKRMLTKEIQDIIDAMGDYDNPLYKTMLLNDLKSHFATLEYAINNWPKISLTIAPVGGGTTKIAGEANVTSKYVPTGQLTVEAVPASGYRFVNWTKGTEEVSTDANYTFNMDAATELTANFEIEESQEGLTTGYYHLISRATGRHEHLYNNAFSSGNNNGYTLQSDNMVNTNNGIWYITVDGSKLGIKNGDGKPVVAGNSNNNGIMGTYSYLNIQSTIDADGYTYYYFSEALNCSASDQGHFKVGGINYLTTWSGHPEATDNQWRLERIDTDGKNIYNVVVECTEKDVYVVYGSGTNEEYAFNGGFFITDATITAQQLAAKKGNDAAQGVTVLVEGKTIRVVDTEYVDITVSASPAEGGTVTINSEATSTKQVVKSSNVTVVATPASGYHFVNWTDAGGNAVSTEASYTFTASENTSLVANFEADVVYHTITVSTYYDNNGGTVKVGEEDATSVNVAEGESVRMLATVANGYEFMGWLKDGVIVKNAIDGGLDFEVQGPDYTLYEIKASAEYVAVFSKITETTGLEDGKAYRICGVQGNGQARCIYRDGNTLKWKYDYDNNDVNTIFVAQKNGNAINLISAVGYHGWKASNMLSNDEQYNPYAAIKVTYGTRDELRTLYIESGTSSGLFQTNINGAFSFQNSRGGGLTMIATDEITTDVLFEEVKNYAFQVSAADGSNAKLGTVNLPFATTVPAEVTVYGVNDSNEDYVYVAPLELTGNVLPANTPVLIEAAASGKYGFKPAPASANVYETGWAGTLEAEEIPGTTYAYILSYKGVGTPIKMYKLSSTDRTINANKAYYIDSTGRASALQFVFGGTTDIEDVEREGNEDTIYDLQGRKLTEITEPGIYIVGGKKVWIK
ncbi:MAG: C10 family peptidase [Bacteroidaceae bacterium]|nr:C10 family peptidase [Bacteroidaceae bacterium]